MEAEADAWRIACIRQRPGHREWIADQVVQLGPPQSFKDLALTIRAHRNGIVNALDSELSDGTVECVYGLIQAAKARAHGYRTHRNLITISYLIGACLKAIPANPYGTKCRAFAA